MPRLKQESGRSVGRTARLLANRGGDGTVWAGQSGALASCSSWTSVFLYTYREILPSPGRLSGGIHTLRLCELPPCEKQQWRRYQNQLTYNEKKRTERRARQLKVHLVVFHPVDRPERTRVNRASCLFERSKPSGWLTAPRLHEFPLPQCWLDLINWWSERSWYRICI